MASKRFQILIDFFFSYILYSLLYFITSNPELLFILGGCSFCITSLKLIIHEYRTSLFRVTFFTAFALTMLLGMGVSSIYFGIYTLPTQHGVLFVLYWVTGEEMANAFLYTAIGFISFYAGAILFFPTTGEIPVSKSEKYKLSHLSLVFLFGVVLYTLQEYIFSIGTFFGFFGSLLSLSIICYFAISSPVELGITKRTHLILFVIGMIILLLLNINKQSKSSLMINFVPLFWYLAVRKTKTVYVVIIVGVIAFTVVNIVFPFVNASRTVFNSENTSKAFTFSNALEFFQSGTYEKINAENLLEYTKGSSNFDQFMNRLNELSATGFIYKEVQKNGYLYGSGLTYLLSAFIPRIVFPNKPIVSRGSWFSSYIYKIPEKEVTTSTGMLAPGELFWNFGYTGVVLGMGFLGALWGAYYKMVHKRFVGSGPVTIMAHYMGVVGLLSSFYPEWGSLIVAVVTYFLFFYFFNVFQVNKYLGFR